MSIRIILLLALLASISAFSGETEMKQESAGGIKHSFLVCGTETYIVSADDKVIWKYPHSTRDGYVLPNGHVLMAVSKCQEYQGGAVIEVDKEGKTVFEFKGTQAEVNSAQPLENGNIVTTESGKSPRLMELTRDGKIAVEFPLKCQTDNAHMETRMARKLPNGNYLAPHLLDFAVKEYKPDGTVVSEIKTPADPKESWPFTAIRLENGNTLIDCTHGNHVIEVDKDGKIVWQLTNKDLPTPLLSDPCGAQRLANGNTVIASYGAGNSDAVKMLEVTPDKKVVWTFKSGKGHGVHEFHIFDAGNQK